MLETEGVFAAQFAELSPLRLEDHRHTKQILQKIFRHVYSYGTFIEPFGYTESFVVVSNHDGPWNPADWRSVDDRLVRIYDGNLADTYSARWHQHLFALPP